MIKTICSMMFLSILCLHASQIPTNIEVRGLADKDKTKELEAKLLEVYQEHDLMMLTTLISKYHLKMNPALSTDSVVVLQVLEYEDLYEAIIDRNDNSVRRILENPDVDVEKIYHNKYTALITASYHGQDEIVKMLLAYGVDIDKQVGKDNNNALGYAILEEHLSTVRLLLEAGANLELAIGVGNITPLMYAVRKESVEIVQYLLEKGANPNATTKEGFTPLLLAIWSHPQKRGNAEIISLLLDRCDINHKTNTLSRQGVPKTALLDAIVMNRSQAFIDNLFAHGAKIGESNEEKVAFLKAYQEKCFKLYEKEEIQRYKDAALKSISYIGYSADKKVQNELGILLSAIVEISIIKGKQLEKKHQHFFKRLADENIDVAAYHDMFSILEKAQKQEQGERVKLWKKKYKEHMPDWCFKELKEWANLLEKSAKNRILSYIKIFETKKC